MIACGRNKIKYPLESRAFKTEYGSQDYKLKGREASLAARIYDKKYRTREKEEEVRMALEGDMGAMPETPLDLLYVGGRFAGFIYQSYNMADFKGLPAARDENTDETTDSKDKRTKSRNSKAGHGLAEGVTAVLIPVLTAGLMSLLTKLILYPAFCRFIEGGRGERFILLLTAHGWVTVAAGILAVTAAAVKGATGVGGVVLPAVFCLLSYAAGAVAVTGIIALFVVLMRIVVQTVIALIPIIAGITVVVMAIKILVKR